MWIIAQPSRQQTALQIISTAVWQSALGAIASAPPHHIKYAAKMKTQRSAGGAGDGRRYRTPVLSFAGPAVAVRPRIGAVRAVPRICGFSLGPPRISGLVRNTWPDFSPALYSRFFFVSLCIRMPCFDLTSRVVGCFDPSGARQQLGESYRVYCGQVVFLEAERGMRDLFLSHVGHSILLLLFY